MSETFRQIVHLLMGVIGAAVILSLDDRGAFIFVSAALVAQFLVCDAITRGYDIPVLSRVMDESERNEKVPLKGGIAYAAGALFCLAVFSREYTAVGLVTVGVLDSVSTLVGLRFGRHVVRGWFGAAVDIDGDDDVALVQNLIDGNRVHDPAVDIGAPFKDHGFERGWNSQRSGNGAFEGIA